MESQTNEQCSLHSTSSKGNWYQPPSCRLAYDANRDGWSSEAFHAAVDTFGAAVVVATTAGGSICGGYNPRGFIGIGEDRDAIAAFLFTWPDGDVSKPAIKLPKV